MCGWMGPVISLPSERPGIEFGSLKLQIWVWQSISPGVTQQPAASMISASAVDQSRSDPAAGGVDDFGVGGDLHVRPYRFDLAVFDQDGGFVIGLLS